MSVNLGYACINTTLQKESKIMCNRGMINRTWLAKGMPHASMLALSNAQGVRSVVEWNNKNNIHVVDQREYKEIGDKIIEANVSL